MPDERSILSRLRSAAPEAAPGVVVAQPGDTLDAVLNAIRACGSPTVQLLVPEGAAALQSVRSFTALRALLGSQTNLIVMSADPKVVSAAGQAGVAILSISDAPQPPMRPRVTPVVNELTQAPPRPTITKPDAEFLANLEQERERAPEAPQPNYTGLSAEEADFYSGLDDLSDAIQAATASQAAGQAPGANRERYAGLSAEEADLYANFDDLSDAVQSEDSGRTAAPRSTPARSSDRVVAGGRSGTARTAETSGGARARREPLGERAGGTTRPTRTPRPRRTVEAQAQPPQRIPYLTLALIALGILALLAFGWIATGTVTILVTPPNAQAREVAIQDAVIPYVAAPDPGGAALVAQPVESQASFTFEARIDDEVLTPTDRARGSVQIVNTIEQSIELPIGTDFIGTNERGEEVRFTLEQPVVVPGAVTVATATGRNTTYGQIDVPVVARSPGSASNIGQNAIKQILIPGQQPIVTDRGNFTLRNEPITGGGEAPQRVVTEAAVQRVLGEALTGLYNEGLVQLRAQVNESQASIDPTTISPDPAALGLPENYDPPVVDPPIGTTLPPENPVFRVTVQARFNGLAVPRDQLISKQLETIIPAYYNQNPICTASEAPGYNITGWRWDGGKLLVNGNVICTLRAVLTPEAMDQVRAAVIGQSYGQAESRLRELQRAGLIGSFSLPDRPQMPGLDFMIRVQPQQGALQQP